jgi:hypothetical protein
MVQSLIQFYVSRNYQFIVLLKKKFSAVRLDVFPLCASLVKFRAAHKDSDYVELVLPQGAQQNTQRRTVQRDLL